MKRFIIIASMMLALSGVTTVASADHSKNWGDNYLEQLLKNGSQGG